MDLKSRIRAVPDFPKKGILFWDITTLLKDPQAFAYAIDKLVEHYMNKKIDKVISAESRGFIFGSALAYKLGAGFVPIRKPKKLPWKTFSESYELEYGSNSIEIHQDAISAGENVLFVDDLLATGGTALAALKLAKKLGAKIAGCCFLIELDYLPGRKKLEGYDIFSLIHYSEEKQ